ncbi:hypothetical protein K469DRAFT_755169 [Zopfia rhizophila CBS 207.26]|uniref:Heterokaryon incompatibility domain-containing protein n=1 Tax=Zopfia rhizophila CBS 207.26 TaxID=1314779 RepID=A0A6A6DGM4_9PEZI|nr:hypothetical protein K469DRAFT_755169 [Zopfia rhizophila CBS 207.26]
MWGDVTSTRKIFLTDEISKYERIYGNFSTKHDGITKRNHQVALMKDIYSQVTQVAVRLGPAADDSDLAKDRINKACDEKGERRRFPLPFANEGRVILALGQRQCWRCIWVIREVFREFMNLASELGYTSSKLNVHRSDAGSII